jgi:alpha-D-ribose 1-methylphosphonate 5-triphosphate diphosphatase
VDFRIHARFEIVNEATAPLLESMLSEHLIDMVSLMDHTPGQGQYADLGRYIDFMEKWLSIPRELLEGKAREQMAQRMQEVAEMPRNWQVATEVCRLAREHGIPIASHDDDTADKINHMHDLGVTISEFPINLEAAKLVRDLGMHTIMGAPNCFRGESNTGNLSALTAIKAGLVDILATDYHPVALIQCVFKLARDGVLPLHESVKLAAQNPAAAVELHDRGRIEVGLKADLVLVEEAADHPRVRGTLRNGHLIYSDAHMSRLAQFIPQAEA